MPRTRRDVASAYPTKIIPSAPNVGTIENRFICAQKGTSFSSPTFSNSCPASLPSRVSVKFPPHRSIKRDQRLFLIQRLRQRARHDRVIHAEMPVASRAQDNPRPANFPQPRRHRREIQQARRDHRPRAIASVQRLRAVGCCEDDKSSLHALGREVLRRIPEIEARQRLAAPLTRENRLRIPRLERERFIDARNRLHARAMSQGGGDG